MAVVNDLQARVGASLPVPEAEHTSPVRSGSPLQKRGEGGARTFLAALAAVSRRSKVVALVPRPSGDTRVAVADGSGTRYATSLDRNRLGDDTSFLATVTHRDLARRGAAAHRLFLRFFLRRFVSSSISTAAG